MFGPLSVETPMNLTSRPASSLLRATRSGSSFLHGPHQVAQKLMNVTLPWKESKSTVFPVLSLQEKFGARSGRLTTLITSATVLADAGGCVPAVRASRLVQPEASTESRTNEKRTLRRPMRIIPHP